MSAVGETLERLCHLLAAISRNRSGAIAVMLALSLTALGGVVALAVNLPQLWNLHSQLQHAADAACLAGATQLDHENGARALAIKAATSVLSENRQNFSYTATDGAPDPAIVTFDSDPEPNTNTDFLFYADLGDPTADPPIPPTIAASDQAANYMAVKADDRPADTPFWALLGGLGSFSPVARSVCYAATAYCNIPPIFTCTPMDAAGNPDWPGAGDVGKGVWLKGKDTPGSTQLFPGNFGLLCLQDADGSETCKAQDISDALARIGGSPACFAVNNELTTKTGEVQGPVQAGLNMRFGIYPNGVHKVPPGEPAVQSNPNYAADTNPVKGLQKGASCKTNGWSQATTNASCLSAACRFPGPLDPAASDYPAVMNNIQSTGFPRDNCAYDCSSGTGGNACDLAAANGSCRPGVSGGRFGDTGEWDIASYMSKNHGTADWTAAVPAIACFRCADGDAATPDMPTRNEVYSWELDNVLAGPPGTTGEDLQNNHPQCGTPALGTVNRRYLPIVLTDCSNVEPGKTTITVQKVIVVLLTEAMGFGPENDNKNLYGEITEVTEEPGLGGILEDVTIRTFKLAQ